MLYSIHGTGMLQSGLDKAYPLVPASSRYGLTDMVAGHDYRRDAVDNLIGTYELVCVRCVAR